jgi:hypothetical protein
VSRHRAAWWRRAASLDHLVGASGEPWRHFEAKRFGGRQVDQEFEFGGLIVTLAARDTIPAM